MKKLSKAICLSGLAIFSSVLTAQNTLERPKADATVSGIYNFSGWDCDADVIEFRFDNSSLKVAASQLPRGDTVGPCGDKNNGYAIMWLTALLGDGQHTVRVYADGVLVNTRQFQVSNPASDKFLRGIQQPELVDRQIVNFGNQINLLLSWDEGQQNFVIKGGSNEYRTTPPTGGDLSPLLSMCEYPGEPIMKWADRIEGYFVQYTLDDTILCAVSYDSPEYPIGQAWSKQSHGYRVIAYDVPFLNRIIGKSRFSYLFVLAHQWGSQVQLDNPGWSASQSPNIVYQADCLAGAFLGDAKLDTAADMTPSDMEDLIDQICVLGHPTTLTHGDCEGRVNAAVRGMDAGLAGQDPLTACR